MSTLIASNLQTPDSYKSGAVHLIETQTASSSATIDFSLPSGYFKFQIVCKSVVPATSTTELEILFSDDAGSTFKTGASDYSYAWRKAGTFTTDTAHSAIITESDIGATEATAMSWLEIDVYDPLDASTLSSIGWRMGKQKADASMSMSDGWGKYTTAAATDAIRLVMNSGNIASGTFKLYGWVS